MEHPASIGKYDLEEFLGGGMSHVFRARDRILGRTVAIKILTPQGCDDADVRNRFLLEAKMAGNISHENIISIYDFGEDQGKPFLVMEFLRGSTLRALMKEERTGDTRNKLWIALQLARALEYVHQQQIVHRDIKPENVHVSEQGCVKLMDFGIAKAHGLSLTQAGFILGTPYYMAPEQVRGEEITPQVDVFAFGVLVYELFAGRLPYKADTPQRVFYCIVTEQPDPEPLMQAGVPVPIQELILQCLRKKAEERPQGFREVIVKLEGLLGDSGAQPTAAFGHVSSQRAEASASAIRQPVSAAGPSMDSTGMRAPGMLGEQPVRKDRKQIGWWLGGAAAILLAAGLVAMLVISRGAHGTANGAGTTATGTVTGAALPATLSTSTGKMVLVAAGDFLYGENRQKTHVDAFYVDRTEVSNRAYASFCQATGRALPIGAPDLPAVNMNITEARQFAQWAGKRLPTDVEWEKAARGTDGRKFPWGNAEEISRANLNHAAPVGVDAFPSGASPYGALQMAGNVWELVDTPRKPTVAALENFGKLDPPVTLDEPWITLRGGGYTNKAIDFAVTWEFSKIPARYSSRTIGFRCVKSANQ